jgi:anthranilate phosphoribosyltransferase
MDEIMGGEATPAQIGAFLTALRIKGETAEEIAGMAGVMRDKALPVEAAEPLVDTCGTGGDASGTFNISTTAAFVVAGAGVKVAKHGNRAASSACGSADVLEALGVKIALSPEGVQTCLQEADICFMFAPAIHPAMKFAAGPRKEIGIRTVFNILGPLTNPARAQHQVIGVADPSVGEKMARVLGLMGSKHALVVHGQDGLDEISLSGPTQVWELKDGTVKSYTISPEDVGLQNAERVGIIGGSVDASTSMLKDVLSGQRGPARDVVLLNAAAALVAADKVTNLKEGLALAAKSIDSREAKAKLEALVRTSQSTS